MIFFVNEKTNENSKEGMLVKKILFKATKEVEAKTKGATDLNGESSTIARQPASSNKV